MNQKNHLNFEICLCVYNLLMCRFILLFCKTTSNVLLFSPGLCWSHCEIRSHWDFFCSSHWNLSSAFCGPHLSDVRGTSPHWPAVIGFCLPVRQQVRHTKAARWEAAQTFPFSVGLRRTLLCFPRQFRADWKCSGSVLPLCCCWFCLAARRNNATAAATSSSPAVRTSFWTRRTRWRTAPICWTRRSCPWMRSARRCAARTHAATWRCWSRATGKRRTRAIASCLTASIKTVLCVSLWTRTDTRATLGGACTGDTWRHQVRAQTPNNTQSIATNHQRGKFSKNIDPDPISLSFLTLSISNCILKLFMKFKHPYMSQLTSDLIV